MKILGLSLGELSTAALLIDDKISACVSEERFTRLKNDECYPLNSIEYVLGEGGVEGKDLDAVVIAGHVLNLTTQLMRTYSSWTMSDHIKAMQEYWYPKIYENKSVSFNRVFKDKIDLEQYPGTWDKIYDPDSGYYSEKEWDTYRNFLHKMISEHIGVPEDRIRHLDHHACHAAYAYWGSPFRGDDVLVMTADAYGDGLSSTLSVVTEEGRLKRVHSVPDKDFTLARLYRYITLLLGMMPNAHEYKVMGLAPYAKKQTLKGPYEVFRNGMYVDGLEFKFKELPKDYYFWFKERLEGFRFDGIAAGLQKYAEEIMVAYTDNAMERFNKRKLVYSGGVSMNIKANMILKDLNSIEDLHMPPSGGDESLAMGACFAYMDQEVGRTDMQPLADAYLGPAMDQGDLDAVIQKAREDGYPVYDASDDFVAALLEKGYVTGRCCGRMEFGARALGNRSINADPRNRSIVEKINEKIKNRDFWMPFAPSVRAEDVNEYIVNPKGVHSPYMTIGFESTERGREELEAGCHPADKTLRPQMVTRDANSSYHALLSAFKKRTGTSGLLNTSFNLHGEPIVNTASDAYRVFKLTDIDALVLEGNVVCKTEVLGELTQEK